MIPQQKRLLLLTLLALPLANCERSDDGLVHMPTDGGSGKTAADYHAEELTPVQALLARARGNVNSAVLKQWALALRVHAESQEGVYAEDLKTLIDTEFLPKPEEPSEAERAIAAAKGSDRKPQTPQEMPRSENEMGTFLETRETPYPPKWTNLKSGATSLPLYQSGLTATSDGKTILLAGTEANPDGTRDVAYLDCTTERISEQDFQAANGQSLRPQSAP